MLRVFWRMGTRVTLTTIVALAIFVVGCRPGAVNAPEATETPRPLQPFLEPNANQQPVLAAFQSAKKSIFMEMYLLTDVEIIDGLKEARRRGIDVRVLLQAHPVGAGTGNLPAIHELQSADVSVQTSNPAYPLTHAKFVVVDERVALIMTLDQTRAAFASNREFGIIDSIPEDVAEIVSVFQADWNRTPPALSNPNLVWTPANARGRLLAFIDQAQTTLDIEAEAMQDEQVEMHLLSAVQRGVAVRLAMTPSQNGPDPNVKAQQKLKQGGVKVRFLKIPFIHANMMVADGKRGFIGSQNFLTVSLDSNRELGILLNDPRIIEGLGATFLTDWDVGK